MKKILKKIIHKSKIIFLFFFIKSILLLIVLHLSNIENNDVQIFGKTHASLKLVKNKNSLFNKNDPLLKKAIAPLKKGLKFPEVVFITSKEKLPKTSTSKDGIKRFSIKNFDSQKMAIITNGGELEKIDKNSSLKNAPHYHVKKLSSNFKLEVKIVLNEGEFWEDGSNKMISYSSHVQKINVHEKVKIKSTVFDNLPTTATKRDGQKVVRVWNYVEDDMKLEISSDDEEKVYKSLKWKNLTQIDSFFWDLYPIRSEQMISIKIMLKNGGTWVDGTTTPLEFSFIGGKQTYVGTKQPTLTHYPSNDRTPTTSTSRDGIKGFKITDFDKDYMTIRTSAGNIDLRNSLVVGLKQGQRPIITISLRKWGIWIDGTIDRIKLSLEVEQQSYVGLTKPAFAISSNHDKTPTTSTSRDGVKGFRVTDFNSKTMKIRVIGGTLKKINEKSNLTDFSISGLKSGQVSLVSISPKGTDKWADGTITPVKIKLEVNSVSNIGIKKPSLNSNSTRDKTPTTKTSRDGVVGFDLIDFDSRTMEIIAYYGILNRENNAIFGLNSGQKAIIKITPKKGRTWDDGTTDSVELNLFTKVQDYYAGLKKPKLIKKESKDIIPKTSISRDGVKGFDLIGFNKDMMLITDNGVIDKDKYLVSNLTSGEVANIKVFPKGIHTWADGTKTPVQIRLEVDLVSIVGIKKPSLNSNYTRDQTPTTSTSRDGAKGFDLIGFDSRTMEIRNDYGSLNQSNDAIINLQSGQIINLTIAPKRGRTWIDGTTDPVELNLLGKTQNYIGLKKPRLIKNTRKDRVPKTSTSSDGVKGFDLIGLNKDMILITDNGVIDKDKYLVSNLTSGEVATIKVFPKGIHTWTDGTKTPVQIRLEVDLVSIVGIKKPSLNSNSTRDQTPTTSTSRDGAKGFDLIGFDSRTMEIRNDYGSLNQSNDAIINLQSGQIINLTIAPKKGRIWVDGTNDSIVLSLLGETQNYIGLKKPILIENKNNDKAPRILSSSDGVKGFVLTNFKTKKMRIKTDHGYLNANNSLITGLKSGQKITIEISPILGEYWKNGTNEAIVHKFDSPISTSLGLLIPKITDSFVKTNPNTKTSRDGIATFIVENFDETKMIFNTTKGFPNYSFSKKEINVSGLKSEEITTITISPKTNFSWFNPKAIDPYASITMPKIIKSPSFIKTNKKDPSLIGGKGQITLSRFSNIIGAKLMFMTSEEKKWSIAPQTGNVWHGRDGFKTDFKWVLDKGYAWENDQFTNPQSQELDNPSEISSLPNIQSLINQIKIPYGSGRISLTKFNNLPQGIELKFRIKRAKGQAFSNWTDATSGQNWTGKKEMEVQFKWLLLPRYVFASRFQPQNPLTRKLLEPVDNIPPTWSKNPIIWPSIDVDSIDNKGKDLEVIVKKEYNSTITLKQIKKLFIAKDNYGEPKISVKVNNNNHNFKFDGQKHVINLIATDLVGNIKKLIVKLQIKHKEINLNNFSLGNVTLLEGFSGFGKFATKIDKNLGVSIPQISIKDKNGQLFPLNKLHAHFIYRMIDDKKSPITWTANDGKIHKDWTTVNLSSLSPFDSNFPKGLTNNHIVQMKLLPNKGYKIIDDSSQEQELDQNMRRTGFALTSKIFEYKVKGLIEILTPLTQETVYTFKGMDGKGALEIDLSKKPTTSRVQWFRPYSPINLPDNKPILGSDDKPLYGLMMYIGKNQKYNDINNWKIVSKVDEEQLVKKFNLKNDDDWEKLTEKKLWPLWKKYIDINNVTDFVVQDSFMKPSEVKGLANFDRLRTIAFANNGYGYKWENPYTVETDINKIKLYPENFVNNINWLPSSSNQYFGKLVIGLTINPTIDIHSKNFTINFLPLLKNQYPYEEESLAIPSYLPSKEQGEKWVWKYRILDTSDNPITNWELNSSKLMQHFKNNNKIEIGYNPLQGYALSKIYANKTQDYIISGLKRKINVESVPRPEIKFSGIVGDGRISDLKENGLGVKYVKSNNNLPRPRLILNQKNFGDIIWEYRVFDKNPNQLKDEELKLVKWLETQPVNLKTDQWVQMRVAPKDKARDGVEPARYSIDPLATSGNDEFTKVRGLIIDESKFDAVKFAVAGDVTQHSVYKNTSSKDPIEKSHFLAVDFQASTDNKIWYDLNYFDNKLNNNDRLSYRAVAKQPLSANFNKPNLTNGIYEKNGKRYFQLPSWKNLLIDKLKITINSSNVQLIIPKIVAMNETPWTDFKGINPKTNIANGWAKLLGEPLPNINKNRFYYTDPQTNNSINAKNLVNVEYNLKEFSEVDNTYSLSGWSTIAPTKLQNNDVVLIRLNVINKDKFKIDYKRTISLEIQDLFTFDFKNADSPLLTFFGVNGEGSASIISKSVSPISKIAYKITNRNGEIVSGWTTDLPTNLQNGYFVQTKILKLNDNVKKIGLLQNDEINNYIQEVSGLVEKNKKLDDLNYVEEISKIKLIGRINHQGTLSPVSYSFKTEIDKRGFEIMFYLTDEEDGYIINTKTIPKNLFNGEKVQVGIVNKTNNETFFKNTDKIIVNGLLEPERNSKTLSKSIWISSTVLGVLILIGFPLYIIIKRKKHSI